MGDLGGAGQPRAAVICGLEAEAEALGKLKDHPHLQICVSGANARRAEEMARAAAAQPDVTLLISWGISGGLDPALASGALLIARVDDPDPPSIHGSERIVGDPNEKRALHDQTGARAVDMETHKVAAAAREAGLPWIAIRAISDPAHRHLPEMLNGLVDAGGRPRVGSAILRLIQRPWLLPKLLEAKKDSDTALATLRAAGLTALREKLASIGMQVEQP